MRSFAAEKVEVRADAAVAGSQAKVDVDMDDGTTLSAFCEHPLGGRENPLSRAQIESKFRSYAVGVLPDSAIAEVLSAVDRLEDFGSVRKLMALLRAAPKSAAGAMAAAE